MLATCALYFEAQSPSKFVNVEESRIFPSVKANSDSDINFLVQVSKAAILLQSPVFSGASIFDRTCRGDTPLRPNRRIDRRCTSGSNFGKVCRGREVKPAATHLSESTSSLSMRWCVSQTLAYLVLAGGALRGSLCLVCALEALRGSPRPCSFWETHPVIPKAFACLAACLFRPLASENISGRPCLELE